MKRFYEMGVSTFVLSIILFSCIESQRNNGHLNDALNEAAAAGNANRFEGKIKQDAEFVYEVVASNYGQIKLAELAKQRSRTPEMSSFAEELIADHTAALSELKDLARVKSIGIPVEESGALRRRLEKVAGESTDDFDEEWCEEMLDQHQKDIGKFERRLADTDDSELQAFIERTIPSLRSHQRSLKAFHESLKEAKR